ncbi:MAG: hypothetical protein KatS3mg119_1819 [Rhodothalassiaceae bacterium]|nr:MAG: hypothetical protein KatS3mg119_1819 [Rhodothalassiaceae bacterium]
MVQMPVRVKPPPADTGETISPGWAALLTTTPANGARMTCLSTRSRASATCSSATSHLRAGGRELALQALDLGLGAGDVGFRRKALGVERPLAGEIAPRLAQLGLERVHAGARGRGLRLGQLERRARQGVVEMRHHLAFRDLLAFLDQNVDEPSRDLGGDRRHPPGDDIARGVEDRRRTGRRG